MNPASQWPALFDPSKARVYAYNELRTHLSPEQLWPVLVEAAAWPSWYRNARDVDVHGGGSQLSDASTFTWTTFGLRVASTVREFVPFSRLAWEGKARGSSGYHRWDLQPAPGGGTLIVTEEVQGGFLARLLGPAVKRSIEKQHQHWLEALVSTAETRAATS